MKHVKMPKVDEPDTRLVTQDEYKALQSDLTAEVAKAKGQPGDLFEWLYGGVLPLVI